MTDPSPLGEAPRLRLDLDKAAAHVVGFCRQVAHDGILPSLAWFSETAETVDALRARSRDDLAAWREQDQALQDIFGACGVDAIISAPSDVARIVIELLAEGAARRGPQPDAFCVVCHRRWPEDGTPTRYCGDCHRRAQAALVRSSAQACEASYQGQRCTLRVGHRYAHHTDAGYPDDISWANDPGVRSSAPPQPEHAEEKDVVSRLQSGATIRDDRIHADTSNGEK